jgi:hypothetical protein
MSMPPSAAIAWGRWMRGSGGGMPSQPPMPPGRGEVSEKSFSQISMWPSGSMPAITPANVRIRSQISFWGPPATSP